MPMRSCFPTILAVVALAACNASEEAGEEQAASAPEPVLTPAPTATAAPDGTALVDGTWNIGEDASGVRALYGPPNTEATLALTCDRGSHAMVITLASTAAAPEAWRLDAGGEAARIDMAPTGGELPQVSAQLDQGLAIIHALAEQGRVFRLTSPAGQPFQFPTHPGIRRVIDTCSQNATEPASAPVN